MEGQGRPSKDRGEETDNEMRIERRIKRESRVLGGINQRELYYQHYEKTPTCNLEGDGEERGDTRLLLSLGLTRCNYRGR